MDISELSIPDSYLLAPALHRDNRGEFVEWFRSDEVEQHTGRRFSVAQANLSSSRRGTVRGIHFADVPPSQAKLVTCTSGSIIDFIVDIRVGSGSFGRWEAVPLDSRSRRAVFLSEGLGHCFIALEEDTTVSYLVSETYRPHREHAINPLDPEIGLEFPLARAELLLSPTDLAAPGLAALREAGALPEWEQAQNYYAVLRGDRGDLPGGEGR